MEFAWSRPKTRSDRESFRFFSMRYDRDRGTFDNIKCFFSAAFAESAPIAEKIAGIFFIHSRLFEMWEKIWLNTNFWKFHWEHHFVIRIHCGQHTAKMFWYRAHYSPNMQKMRKILGVVEMLLIQLHWKNAPGSRIACAIDSMEECLCIEIWIFYNWIYFWKN